MRDISVMSSKSKVFLVVVKYIALIHTDSKLKSESAVFNNATFSD